MKDIFDLIVTIPYKMFSLVHHITGLKETHLTGQMQIYLKFKIIKLARPFLNIKPSLIVEF